MSETPIPSRRWLHGLYAVGALLVVQPVAETMAAAWPLRLGEVGWRFGTTGSFMILVSTLVVGLGLLALTAYLLSHRLVLRAVGVASLVLAVALVLVTASFALDYVQLRRMIRPDVKGGFDLAALKAGVSALLAILALAFVGVSGLRASRLPANKRAPRRREAGEGLIVGRSS